MAKPKIDMRGGPGPRASAPPPGYIGPPNPLPIHDEREMGLIVSDCAGVDLDGAVVKRLIYMMRRAHGIGLAQGMAKGIPKAQKKRPRANPVASGIMRRALRGT